MTMNSTEAKDKFNKFSEKNPELFKKAEALTGDYKILAKIYDNIKLFSRINKSGCLIYSELVFAIFALETLPDESILIQFTEIDLYGIFTSEQYLNFIKNLGDDIEEYDISVNLYQVVISGKKQKLVFACTDFKYFDKLQNYARDCFGEDVSKSSNQLTVNIITQNEAEIADNYNKLYNFINNRNDQPCCESMKQIQLLQAMQYKFRKYSCNDTLSAKNMEELVKALRGATINAPIIIGNYNIIGNQNKQIINQADPKQSARDWIKNNPPADRESSGKYFERWQAANIPGVDIRAFNKAVIEQGYQNKKTAKCQIWISSTK